MPDLFYYHPRMLAYSFGPSHPFKPERLSHSVETLQSIVQLDTIDPGPGLEEDLHRVHDSEYLGVLRAASEGRVVSDLFSYGLGPGDNPPFQGMWEATLAFTAGTVAAARAVRDGASLATTLAGGLHHARRAQASGFCLANDCAIALAILRERFDRVAYVDIDLHHGDGVQWIFWDDPAVLTCSIHETGRTLYPGTGFVDEVGPSGTCVNAPLAPYTTGDVWLDAFRRGIVPAIEAFGPQAVVLQMGADPHYDDPLGHLRVTIAEWLEAVRLVRDIGLPLVACGGGGYAMHAVVRSWSAAILTLYDLPVPDELIRDAELPGPRNTGREEAEAALAALEAGVLARLRDGRAGDGLPASTDPGRQPSVDGPGPRATEHDG
jgi:acetoin utilization protein AcuC